MRGEEWSLPVETAEGLERDGIIWHDYDCDQNTIDNGWLNAGPCYGVTGQEDSEEEYLNALTVGQAERMPSLGKTIQNIGNPEITYSIQEVKVGPYGVGIVAEGNGGWVAGEPVEYDGRVVLAMINGYSYRGEAEDWAYRVADGGRHLG
jgi:hypothetical protein